MHVPLIVNVIAAAAFVLLVVLSHSVTLIPFAVNKDDYIQTYDATVGLEGWSSG